jgi:hypothetical protein
MKSRRLSLEGHVSRTGEERGVCRILVVKPEGKRPLGNGRITLRWIIKKWDVGYGLD